MDRDERMYKLDNGSDTAIWAASEIRRLEARVSELEEALKEIGRLPWGWDGGRGAYHIINRVFD
jgi:hypothetical protein